MDLTDRHLDSPSARPIPSVDVTSTDRSSTLLFARSDQGPGDRSNAGDSLVSTRPHRSGETARSERFLEKFEVVARTEGGVVPAARIAFSLTPDSGETRITYRELGLMPSHAPTARAERSNRLHANDVRFAIIGAAVDRADAFGQNGVVVECADDSALVRTLRLSADFHRMNDPDTPSGMVSFRYDPLPTD